MNIAESGNGQYRCTTVDYQARTPVVEQLTTAPSGVGVICLGNMFLSVFKAFENFVVIQCILLNFYGACFSVLQIPNHWACTRPACVERDQYGLSS